MNKTANKHPLRQAENMAEALSPEMEMHQLAY